MFSIGSVVHLRSGGPLLTVVSSTNAQSECVYVANDGVIHSRQIPNAALILEFAAVPLAQCAEVTDQPHHAEVGSIRATPVGRNVEISNIWHKNGNKYTVEWADVRDVISALTEAYSIPLPPT